MVCCYAVGAVVGAAVGGAVLIVAVIAIVIYGIHRRRVRSVAPTTPASSQARAIDPKPDEAAAALNLVTTAETVAPHAAPTIALTEISRHVEVTAVPELAPGMEHKGA